MLEQVLSTLSPALEIVGSLTSGREDRLDRRYGDVRDEIVAALRRIYFTPEGIRGLLRDFAEGRQPSREAIEEVLSDFNDAEWRVDSSLERLSFHYLGDRKELSLRAAEQLDKIRYGKIDIRRQLQEGLNEILTQGEDLDPKLANDLLGKVEALNGLIVALEEEHNYRARGR